MRYFRNLINVCSILVLIFSVYTVSAKTDGVQNIDGRDGKTQQRPQDGKASPSKDGKTLPSKSAEQPNKNTQKLTNRKKQSHYQ